MTPLGVVPYMGLIAGAGILIDSAEVIHARRALSPSGLYPWEVLSAGRRYLVKGRLSRPLGSMFRYPAVLILPGVQVVSALALIGALALPPGTKRVVIVVAALSAVVARVLFYMRQQLGLDGADQMFTIVLLSCGFGAALGNTPAGLAAVSYASLQLILAYEISGIAKAVSRQWRSGQAIVGITGTVGYGHAGLHTALARHPVQARVLCWSVIAFECGSPLLVFGGVRGVELLIAAGLAFHIGIALIMGLNTFVWAFAATYPAVMLMAEHVHHVLG